MAKSSTNISIVLGIITIGFAGYYLYTQRAVDTVSFDTNTQTMENMLIKAQVFITYRETLDQIKLDTNILEDERFTSLRSFTTDIKEQKVGRPDPFADVDSN